MRLTLGGIFGTVFNNSVPRQTVLHIYIWPLSHCQSQQPTCDVGWHSPAVAWLLSLLQSQRPTCDVGWHSSVYPGCSLLFSLRGQPVPHLLKLNCSLLFPFSCQTLTSVIAYLPQSDVSVPASLVQGKSRITSYLRNSSGCARVPYERLAKFTARSMLRYVILLNIHKGIGYKFRVA